MIIRIKMAPERKMLCYNSFYRDYIEKFNGTAAEGEIVNGTLELCEPYRSDNGVVRFIEHCNLGEVIGELGMNDVIKSMLRTVFDK